MFDQKVVLETEGLAQAIKSLAALSITPEQLKMVKVTDDRGVVQYVAPGLITRISETQSSMHGKEVFSTVRYINGDSCSIILPLGHLAQQLGLDKE